MLDDLLQASILISVAAATIRIATPVLLAALGEMVAQRTGVYNMGLEGTMLMGAFVGYFGAYQTGSLWLGLAFSMLTGGLISLLFAFIVITMKVEQIVTGLAFNLLGAGLSIFWLRSAFAEAGRDAHHPLLRHVADPVPQRPPSARSDLLRSEAPHVLGFPRRARARILLFEPAWGSSCAAHRRKPQGARYQGLSVAARQYGAVVFGGMLAGLGGAFLSVGSDARFVPT